MPTVEQIFNQLHIDAWWKSTPTQVWGVNGEKGADYGLGGMGKPVGSITAGKVVYVGDGGYPGDSIGQIVQVLTPSGELLHYQHLKTSSVHTGQTISVGQIIGTGGGCPAGAYYADPSRNDCKWYDAHSSGQHIEVRYAPSYSPGGGVWLQAWQDPRGVFANIGTHSPDGLISKPGGGGTGTPPSSGDILATLNLPGLGQKIGLFLLALILLAAGAYLLFQKQINSGIKSGAKIAEKAVL